MAQIPDQGPNRLMKTVRVLLVTLMVGGVAHPITAQPKYTVHDLGTLSGIGSRFFSAANGINSSGQVIGYSGPYGGPGQAIAAFRTAPNSPINPATDDLGTLG